MFCFQFQYKFIAKVKWDQITTTIITIIFLTARS